LGDILEVSTPRGLAYVQYAGKHPEYGDAIRVLPGFFKARPREWSTIVTQEGYFAFYPAMAAVSQGLVLIAANHPIPRGHELPSIFRRRGARTPDGKVLTWIIFDGENETLKTTLSPEEKRLSIASIWNHAFLVERLVGEWRPDKEPRSAEVAQEQPLPGSHEAPPLPSGPPSPLRLTHYLYFPTAKAARPVATDLRKRGFEVESRPSADEEHWLLLASHPVTADDDVDRIRDSLEQLAQQHQGNYDGSEIAI
jgi:hypothetical protein